jgi:hypothetical protein
MTGVVAVMAGYGPHRAPVIVPPSGTGSYSTYTSGGNTYGLYTFTSGGTFTVNTAGSYDVVIIGAGGGGSTGLRVPSNRFGTNIYDRTGFSGQYVAQTQTLSAGSYSVAVGTGGTGAVWNYNSNFRTYQNTYPTSGTSSSFNGVTAAGGGTNNYGVDTSYHSSDITGATTYYAQNPIHTTGTADWTPQTPRGYYGDGGDGGKGAPPSDLTNTLGGATNAYNGGNGVVFIRYQIS